MTAMTATNTEKKGYFVGSYVSPVVDAALAALASRKHLVVLGGPGKGKTGIMTRVSEIAPKSTFVRLEPSTSPAELKGAYDPAAMLNGITKRITDGTPYESGMKVAVVDEVGRASDAVLDIMLDVLDRGYQEDEFATVLATSNFMPTSERTEAFNDRFALWVWLDDTPLDAREVSLQNLISRGRPHLSQDLPTWEEIVEARNANPSDNMESVSLCLDVIEALTDAAREGIAVAGKDGKSRKRFSPQGRRFEQWVAVLYHASVLFTGRADFEEIPSRALRLLPFMYPAVKKETQSQWSEVCASLVDAVESALEVAQTEALERFRRVASLKLEDRGPEIGPLGEYMISQGIALQSLAKSDREKKQVEDALATLQVWFSNAIAGNDPKAES